MCAVSLVYIYLHDNRVLHTQCEASLLCSAYSYLYNFSVLHSPGFGGGISAAFSSSVYIFLFSCSWITLHGLTSKLMQRGTGPCWYMPHRCSSSSSSKGCNSMASPCTLTSDSQAQWDLHSFSLGTPSTTREGER